MENDEKANILVVDDLPEKLLIVETILEGLGQNIVKARSGREALRSLLEGEFAVILLDVNMPDMDGLETAAMIRSRRQNSDTPIIFITAFVDEAHLARGYSLGAVDYIFSPVIPEVLRTKVGVFVDLYKKTRQVKRQAEEHVKLAREQAARVAAEEANRRANFLAEASAALTRSLDYDETLLGLARVLVPFLGDSAAVTVIDDRSGLSQTQVARHEPTGEGGAPAPADWPESDPHLAGMISQVLATGRPALGPTRPGEPETRAMVVPLDARGRVLGVLTIATGPSGRQLDRADLSLAEDLAGRAAIAIDNARLYRDIQEDDRRKNEFLAMLAHELRNPLAPIRNSVKILQATAPRDEDAEVGWAVEVIGRQVAQMVRLVDDLLDLSRITGGKVQLRMEPVDVSQVVAHALETSRPLVDSKGQTLEVDLPDRPVWVEADQARLSQVLANLLNNASKYTGDGGRIWLDVEGNGREVVFRVRDSGIGIPAEMISKVFDLFVQVDRSLDRSQGGLGIGLTLVRHLMELHGGTVEVRSDGPGLGSEFVLTMPAIDPVGANLCEPTRAGASPEPVAPSRVLVVDDNVDSARSLSRLLRLSGHEVRMVHDGSAALEQFEASKPDIVLLDIGLPGMDGYEVARRIRDRPDGGDVLLVALTGYGREEDRVRSQAVGFDRHFVKPVDLESLLPLLQRSKAPA